MTDDPSTLTVPDAAPVPPRYWWLKRIVLGSLLLLVVLVAVRVWWGREAHRLLQAEIDRLVVTGEPIFPADFDPPEIKPEENAAKLLIDAEAALNLTPEQGDLLRKVYNEFDEIRERVDEVKGIIEANQATLRLIRQARGLTRYDWGVRLRSPVYNALFPNLSGQRRLAKMLQLTAGYQHSIGRDGEAVETLRDAVAQARAQSFQPALIGHLVFIACRASVARSVEYLAPRLAIVGDAPERTESETAPRNRTATVRERPESGENDARLRSSRQVATREAVQALIAELLDETEFNANHVRALQTERTMALDSAKLILRGNMSISAAASGGPIVSPPWWERASKYPFDPLFELDTVTAIRFLDRQIDAAREPNWPAANALLPKERNRTRLASLTHPISRIMLPSFSRAIFLHHKSAARTRMAAIALAIRLFEIDHGRRPEQLIELVPDYLPAVPVDPLAADDRPIGYKPNAAYPILYSVGQNGEDDDGAYTIYHVGFGGPSLDMPFFLAGLPPREEPTSEE